MKRHTIPTDPTFLPASLAASKVGTWEYDVVQDRLRYCKNFAVLYGLPLERGSEGVSMGLLAAATHPDDRARSQAKRMHLFQHGGVFVHEHRVLPSPYTMRWLLVRGFYEADGTGRITRGRGITLDVTDCKQEGFADGDVFFLTEADDRSVSALDRATRHVLAARRALNEVGPEGNARLQDAADALLLEIAQHIAGTMIPIELNHTQH